jgi:hypothetical protein
MKVSSLRQQMKAPGPDLLFGREQVLEVLPFRRARPDRQVLPFR